MLYISSQKGDKWGVTDTDDNLEQFITGREIVRIMRRSDVYSNIYIYGVDIYNHEANCTVLHLGKKVDGHILNELVKKHRNYNTSYSRVPLINYFTELRVCTKIVVDYKYVGDGDIRPHIGTSTLFKKGYDDWLFKDTDSLFSGRRCTNFEAVQMFEVSCIYATPIKIYDFV